MNLKYHAAVILILFLFAGNIYGQKEVECWDRFELTFNHTEKGNPFSKVKLSATFVCKGEKKVVDGFYDGNNVYKIRFMPATSGEWTYTTSSNISSMNNQKGKFMAKPSTDNNHGMVVVDGKHNFKYADGTRYYPIGTTAYAWTHMKDETQEQTLATLKESGFNKVRMCVFPKNYPLVKDEPLLFPFELKGKGKDQEGNDTYDWDFERFDPAFFQHLEKRIDQLNDLGIESDLIIFHPYDKGRWGFDEMSNEVNIRYIQYLTARLASFRNVWWSLANEWDYVKAKTLDDWDLLTKTVVKNDPYGHLCSIHGATATYYDYWKPEITHVSIQDEAPVMSSTSSATLRKIYQKPVVCDEVCYEGNLQSRWGRLSPQQMTHFFLNGVLGGVYVTHGECYQEGTDPIFWAQGGKLKGSSWKYIRFIRSMMEDLPNPLEMADISRDLVTSTAGEGYYIINMGKVSEEYWQFNLPAKNADYGKVREGKKFKVEIINVWDMTVTEYPGIFETTSENDYRVYDKNLKGVRIPGVPDVLLRIKEIK